MWLLVIWYVLMGTQHHDTMVIPGSHRDCMLTAKLFEPYDDFVYHCVELNDQEDS